MLSKIIASNKFKDEHLVNIELDLLTEIIKTDFSLELDEFLGEMVRMVG